jgi:hypothetical protein
MGSAVRRVHPLSPQRLRLPPGQERLHGPGGRGNCQQNGHSRARQPGERSLRSKGDQSGPQPEHHQSRQKDEQAAGAGGPRLIGVWGPIQQYMSRNPLPIYPIGSHQKGGDEGLDQKLGN